MTTPLSSAAQAVLNAINKALDESPWDVSFLAGASAAASIRAIADQVVPSDSSEPRNYLPALLECQRIRAELLAIASELESANG
jgi:hypothetical protein